MNREVAPHSIGWFTKGGFGQIRVYHGRVSRWFTNHCKRVFDKGHKVLPLQPCTMKLTLLEILCFWW